MPPLDIAPAGGRDLHLARLPTYDRRIMRSPALAAAVAGLALLAAAPAEAKPRTCKSSDLRFPFQPGGPKTFGVFQLKVTGGTCTTAHRVAKDWKRRFEANLDRGSEKLPKHVDGFTFTQVPVHEAQTFGLKGVRGATTVRFHYVVPNG
jgi:hypothetical protein